ncbi:diacylglycerol/lipid kinase family protein [Deinococcus arcticus]|uniref:Diacylglycerol kinase n=1 Tax=Deinococcus arcticus TaxID=2136176 RepID=A0A2T3WDA3_9DEIO|nr:diacylglycerol kinase family protein [Deinococcus arcticus]PTA69885.1 diacylglycerol kinase [Deinococcus arcticus]
MTPEDHPVFPLPPLAVVLNPRAGRGLAAREWPRLQRELQARGLEHTLIQEESGEAALARVQALPPDVAVMAVGGDGTVGALLGAVVGTGRPLAIVPLGTGNDFAGLLGLKPGAFGEALDRLNYQPRALDALELDIVAGDEAGRRFVLLNGLGMGFDSDVTANMDRAPARLRGFARYAYSALSTLRALQLAEVAIVADGQPLYAGPSAIVAVMNGVRYGGGFRISPQSDVRDGQLNVVAGGAMTRRQLAGLMARVLRGAHLSHPLAHHVAAREVQVRWATPVRIHLDGDLHGRVSEIRVRVLPGAARLLNA